MNGHELSEFISNYPSIVNNFLGTFSINTLPKKISLKHFLFCNTDFNFEPGSHWICFLKQSKNSIECFDSLGLDATKQELIKSYCSYKNIKFNITQFQPLESKACGKFVIYFSINRMHNLDLSFKEFLQLYFQTNPEQNEFVVNEFFK